MSSAAIQEAIARAKEIASRLSSNTHSASAAQNPPMPDAGGASAYGVYQTEPEDDSQSPPFEANYRSTKRQASDDPETNGNAKRFAPQANVNDKLDAIRAKLNQKLGVPQQQIPSMPDVLRTNVIPRVAAPPGEAPVSPADPNSQKPFVGMVNGRFVVNVHTSMPGVISEDTYVPDKFVGMMIGRGGENIQRLQTDSQCKIQIVQESRGTPERPVTIVGLPENVEHAKQLLQTSVERANVMNAPLGNMVVGANVVEEMRIPNAKVGAVIGRAGEIIRAIEGKFGVKMHVIQDIPDPEKIVRMQGSKEQVDLARKFIQSEIIENAGPINILEILQKGEYHDPESPFGGSLPIPHAGTPSDLKQTTFSVPSDKAGLVIGRGGESVKEIRRATGAHVVMLPPPQQPDARVRVFRISGNVSQIDQAVKAICQRAGLPPPPPPPPHMLQPYSPLSLNASTQLIQPNPQAGSMSSGPMGMAPNSMSPVAYPGHYPPAPPAAPTQTPGAPGFPSFPQTAYPGFPGYPTPSAPGAYPWAAAAPNPQTAASAYPPWQQGAAAPGGDYYSQYYSQYGQWAAQAQAGVPAPPAPQSSAAQPALAPTQPTAVPAAPAAPAATQPSHAPAPEASSAATNAPAATTNPATGQPDYSQAWAEYYRRMGMPDYADAILKQQAQPQAQATSAPAQPAAAPAPPAPPVPQAPAAPAPVQPQAAQGTADQYAQYYQQYYAQQFAAQAAAAAAAAGAAAPK